VKYLYVHVLFTLLEHGMKMQNYYTYILSGQEYGPIFVEAVQDIIARIVAHKRGHLSEAAYRIDRLVYVERHNTKQAAEARVMALKSASREWVDALIERSNPYWQDLAAVETSKQARAA